MKSSNSYYRLDVYDGISINKYQDSNNLKTTQILKIILLAKNKDTITLDELQQLADSIPQQEFEEFCQKKKLDLTINKFKTLELSQYKFANLEPLLKLGNEKLTILNLLLSRTFSDKLTSEEINKIYTDLYNLDPISKEIITYTASLISKNNSIKILFSEGTSSYYLPKQNIIKIENSFINKIIFNIASVVIHEMSHFIYYQVYKNGAMPFSLVSINNFISKNSDATKDPFVYQHNSNPNTINSLISQEVEIMAPIMEYERVARTLVDKASELILVNPQEYSKYIFASEYTEWLKQNSYIDLFAFSSMLDNQADRNVDSSVPDHIFDNIHKIYLSEQGKCEVKSALENPFYYPREEVITWVKEVGLPNYISKLNLSPTQVHFVQRVADYISRGEHLLHESNNKFCSNYAKHEKYAEGIVRCMEFKAAGLDADLTDACKGLEYFHIKYVSPDLCKDIQSSEAVAMPFDAGMLGEVYQCLINE